MGGSIGFLDGVSEQEVGRFVQSLTILNFEALRNLLTCLSVRCFSIAVDAGTNNGASYLDVRIRLVHDGVLRNLHVMAIPFTDAHTGENMRQMVDKVLTVLCGESWCQKLLSITTYGAANMVGRHRGQVSLLEGQCTNPIFRVWCGAHQLDLIVENCLSKNLHSTFYQPLTSLISYLRRQQKFASEVGCRCPTVATTRCLSLGRVVRWIVTKRSEITEYIDREDTASFESPCTTWWLLLFAVEALMEIVDVCFRAIQGKDTLVVEQTDYLSKCRAEIHDTFSITISNGVEFLSATALGTFICTLEGITTTSDGMANFFENCGTFSTSCLHSLNSVQTEALFVSWGKTCVHFSYGLDNLCVERLSANTPLTRIPPPVMPIQVAEMNSKSFLEHVQLQRDRLLLSWTPHQIEDIEDDLRRFHRAFRRGHIPQECLRRVIPGRGAMKKAWGPISSRFKALAKFTFGLATIFPGTATVESDFSHINRESSSERANLTSLSLQGVLFARQWKDIRRLRVWGEADE